MRIKMEVYGGMRLYNTYYLCRECIDDISDLNFSDMGTGQAYQMQDWEKCKNAMAIIRQIPFLKKYVDSLYDKIPVFVRENAAPKVDFDTRNKILRNQREIVAKMQAVIELYESLDVSTNENGIDVKIPPCNSLKEYITYLKEIDFIFSQCPFLQHESGEIKYRAVDVGSQWLTFFVAAAAGTAAVSYIFNNLAMLVDKAVQLKSHLTSLKQQEEILRSQKLQDDILNSNVEIFNTLKSHYLSEAVNEMENSEEGAPLKDGDERGRAEKSIEKLCVLLDKGVQIYASVDTDRQIQMLFPPLGGNVELPESILKLIEEKKEG